MRRRNRLGSRFFIGVAVVVVLCILSALYSGVTGNPSPVTRIVGFVTTPAVSYTQLTLPTKLEV